MPKEILMTFGRRLKFAREDARMTQQELADEVQINKSMITAYENGTTDPRMSIMSVWPKHCESLLCG